MTAGWGETEVLMDVSSRRLARVLHRLLAEHGLLSFLSLLRAFPLNVIKRNQAVVMTRLFWRGSGAGTSSKKITYLTKEHKHQPSVRYLPPLSEEPIGGRHCLD